MDRVLRYALGYWFFCVGVLVVMAPWTPLWGRNWFVHRTGALSGVLLSAWGRGALSGVGALYLLTGVRDTLRLAAGRWEEP